MIGSQNDVFFRLFHFDSLNEDTSELFSSDCFILEFIDESGCYISQILVIGVTSVAREVKIVFIIVLVVKVLSKVVEIIIIVVKILVIVVKNSFFMVVLLVKVLIKIIVKVILIVVKIVYVVVLMA